jgi:hypothetical protein
MTYTRITSAMNARKGNGIVRAIGLCQPFRPLQSWVRAPNNGLLGIDQAGRDSRRQQPAQEDYQIGLV